MQREQDRFKGKSRVCLLTSAALGIAAFYIMKGSSTSKRSAKGDFRSNFSKLIYTSVAGLNVINAAFAYVAFVKGDNMTFIPA